MELQYISDSEGKHTAVVIPIADWNIITAKHADLKEMEKFEKRTSKRKPSDFMGCLSKETALKMIAEVEQSRNEWERDI